jgi:hypothetical protein
MESNLKGLEFLLIVGVVAWFYFSQMSKLKKLKEEREAKTAKPEAEEIEQSRDGTAS